MIVNNRIEEYICSLDEELPKYLQEIEREALDDGVPIIKRPTQNLIRFILRHANIKKVLEVGTAVGFSSIFMTEYMGQDSKVITIENMESRIIKAHENIKKSGKEYQIQVIEGDATVELSKIEGSFDMIFIDAAKGKYPIFLKEAIRMLKKDGIILADNILYKGYTLSNYNKHKQRTAVRGLREYLKLLEENKDLETEILEIGDGLAISKFKRIRLKD